MTNRLDTLTRQLDSRTAHLEYLSQQIDTLTIHRDHLALQIRQTALTPTELPLDEIGSNTVDLDTRERPIDKARQIKLDSDAQTMAQRRAALVKLLSTDPDLPVKILAELLHVSRQTIYNDLNDLNGERNHALSV